MSSNSGGRHDKTPPPASSLRTSSTPSKTVLTPHLPVIIFPGFMSSGLYVKKSSIAPGWEDKRLWINLSSLGIHSIHFGGDVAKNTHKEEEVDNDHHHQSPSSTTNGGKGGMDASSKVDAKDVDEEEGITDIDTHAVDDDDDDDDDDFNFDGSTLSEARSNTKKNEAEGRRMRSLWLQHIMLRPDMVTEPDGVEVRNLEGLAGVDYLSPGALTSYVSYVFGPVINALREVGYDDDQAGNYTLDAAPYDWRLPPHFLEKRDSYMTRTMRTIERLYSANNDTPVVMVCHSLGCKTAHYFLIYVEENFGREWIDKHIHAYMPVGAPHLGAPSAVRSLVSGEKMGLDTFLSDAESLAFGRSIGSGPFLLPTTLPVGAPPNAFLRTEGAVEVWLSPDINVQPIFERRLEGHAPQKLKLTVVYNNKQSASSPWTNVEGDVESLSQTVSFGEKFTFSIPPDGLPDNARLTVLLCEPGVRSARASDTVLTRAHRMGRRNVFTKGVWSCNDCDWYDPVRSCVMNYPGSYCVRMVCCCPIICPILKWIIFPLVYLGLMIYFGILYVSFWIVFRGSLITLDELSKLSGRSSVAAHATVRKNELCGLADETASATREVRTNLFKASNGCCGSKVKVPVTLHVRFISPTEGSTPNTICSPVGQPAISTSDGGSGDGARTINFGHVKKGDIKYEAQSAFNMISREGNTATLDAIKNQYDNDPLDPRERASFDRPPVGRIKAVYGINLPTEVGAVYKRHKAVVDRHDTVLNYHCLDTHARVLDEESGYVTEGGKLLETENTVQPDGEKISGDGTVPYWSMQHVKTWNSKDCNVTVDTLDGAPHREILADSRFHDLLTSYVCNVEETDEKKTESNEC